MPIYYGSTRINRISFGGTEVDRVYYGRTLVFQHGSKYVFPTTQPIPAFADSSEVLDSVSGQNYKIGIIPEDGWYRIATRAATGGSGYNGGGATGGCVSDAIVFLYKDSKYLIWGASGQYTGYISPSDTALGGRGDHGGYSGESGGGGGAAGGHGQRIHSDSGAGGGGTGCIVGLEHDGQTLTEEWSHGGFELTSVEAMVLAGGGGGGIGDNGEPRTGGAGGGAWGRGGRASYGSGRTSGPGEEFGHGQDSGGGYWAGPTTGAWCVRDYSNPRFDYGVGVKSGNSCPIGSTYIYKVNLDSLVYDTPGTYTVTIDKTGYYSIKVAGAGGGAAGAYYEYSSGIAIRRKWYKYSSIASGGSGSYTCADNVLLTKGVQLTIIVGAEGTTSALNSSTATGGQGGESSVKITDGDLIVQANGGNAGYAVARGGGHAGSGGTPVSTPYTTSSANGLAGQIKNNNVTSTYLHKKSISASAAGGAGQVNLDNTGAGKSISCVDASYSDPNPGALRNGRVRISLVSEA